MVEVLIEAMDLFHMSPSSVPSTQATIGLLEVVKILEKRKNGSW